MKKVYALLLLVCLLLPVFFVPSAAAEDSGLPFELTPPQNVSATWLEGNDSPTTMQIAYSIPNDMAEFYKKVEEAHTEEKYDEFISRYDFDEIWTNAQIDWAVDDVNDEVSGWHYNEYWDGDDSEARDPGYDQDFKWRVSSWDAVDVWLSNATETVQDVWVLRGLNETEWAGNPDEKTPGVKEQLRDDQYEYYDEDVHIDFSKHTVYFRMRLRTVTRTESGDRYYFTDWTEPVAVGKDAEKYEPLKAGDINPPEITDLRLLDTEFNDLPVAGLTLTVPEDLQKKATEVAAHGGVIWIRTEARVKGDPEWVQMQNAEGDVKPGEMEIPLVHLASEDRVIDRDTEIEVRCQYVVYQQETDDIFSDYSNILSFGTSEISVKPGETEGAKEEVTEDGSDAPAEKSCPICHRCSQPLGLCIFIWLAIILAVVIIITVVVIVAVKKNKDKK